MPYNCTAPHMPTAKQNIMFSEADGVCTAQVFSTHVEVNSNAGSHTCSSSTVKLHDLVDYNGEFQFKYYHGQLIALHFSKHYLAYCTKAPARKYGDVGNDTVCIIVNPLDLNYRSTFIRGIKGEVQDIGFAHIPDRVMLACINEIGTFYIYEIVNTVNSLNLTLRVQIKEESVERSPFNRLVWCPVNRNGGNKVDDYDTSGLLVTIHDHTARLWDTHKLCALPEGTAMGAYEALTEQHAGLKFVDTMGARAHCPPAPLRSAAFSMDGILVATVGVDGYVIFYKIDMQEDVICSLYKCQPHGGKPVNAIVFLDNYKSPKTSHQLWKVAVTESENELKIWSCKTWSCLQTITFASKLSCKTSALLKISVDPSSTYILVSNYTTNTMYILHMVKEEQDSIAYCCNIAEFLMPHSILSYSLMDIENIPSKAGDIKLNHQNTKKTDDAACWPKKSDKQYRQPAAASGADASSALVRFFFVQPKGLHFCEITDVFRAPQYQGGAQSTHVFGPDTQSILQMQTEQMKNLHYEFNTQPCTLYGHQPHSLQSCEAFSEPRTWNNEQEFPAQDVGYYNVMKALNASMADERSSSGDSSPSREVQRILAHTPTEYYKDPDGITAPLLGSRDHAMFSGPIYVPPKRPQPKFNIDNNTWLPMCYDKGLGNRMTDKEYGAALMAILNMDADNICLPTAMRIPSAVPLCAPHPPLNTPQTPLELIPPPQPPLDLIAPPRPPLEPIPPPQPPLGLIPPPKPPLELIPPPQLSLGMIRPPQLLHEPRADNKFEALQDKIDTLSDLMKEQRREIVDLRSEIEMLQESKFFEFEEIIGRQTKNTTAAVAAAFSNGSECMTQLEAKLNKSAAETARKTVAQAMAPIADVMRKDLAENINNTQQMMLKNINILINSRDQLTESLVTVASEALPEAIRLYFASGFGPEFERMQSEMSKQYFTALQEGLVEFGAHVSKICSEAVERGVAAGLRVAEQGQQRAPQAGEQAHQAGEQAHQAGEQAHQAGEQAHQAVEQTHQAGEQVQQAGEQAHERIADGSVRRTWQAAGIEDMIRRVLEKELAWWRQEHLKLFQPKASSVPLATPSDILAVNSNREGLLHHINYMVSLNYVDYALEMALDATDLNVLMATCRMVRLDQVFGPPCRLRQTLLLSFVQQLAADLTVDLELKCRFLEGALMNLDLTFPFVKYHVSTLITNAQNNMAKFHLHAHRRHELARKFQRLMLICQYIINVTK